MAKAENEAFGEESECLKTMIECLIEPAIENKPQEKMVSLEKVVEYLEANFPDIENVGSLYKESFIRNFRKVMEE